MPTVLIVDDDPSHLKIYSWIVERGGFRSLPVLAAGDRFEMPDGEPIDAALLDYRLGERLTAVDVAKQVVAAYPAVPILVLSDMMYLPEDAEPYATAFVRKGQPDKLLETLSAAIGLAAQPKSSSPAA